MRRASRKAQSVLEYTIILAAIIGAVIAAAGLFKTNTTTGYNDAASIINSSMSDLKSSLGTSGGSGD